MAESSHVLSLYASECFQVEELTCQGHDNRCDDEVSGLALVFCRRGLFLVSSEDGQHLVEPGRALLLQPQRSYDTRHLIPGGDECTNVWVSADVLEELRVAHGLRAPHFLGAITLSSAATFLAFWIHTRALAASQSGLPRARDLGIDEALHHLAESVVCEASGQVAPSPSHLARGRNRDAAMAVTELLHQRYREPLDLAEISREVGVSTYHLCRVFRANTGRTIHAHQNGLRLADAVRQLAGGARDLSRVARSLGFSSHSHFSAAFRRNFGVAPSAFRRGLDRPPLSSGRESTVQGDRESGGSLQRS